MVVSKLCKIFEPNKLIFGSQEIAQLAETTLNVAKIISSNSPLPHVDISK